MKLNSTILCLDIRLYDEMLILHKYNSKYARLFQNEKKKLNNALNNICLVDHIGSTAIPGVDGKGIIDIMLVYQRYGRYRICN